MKEAIEIVDAIQSRIKNNPWAECKDIVGLISRLSTLLRSQPSAGEFTKKVYSYLEEYACKSQREYINWSEAMDVVGQARKWLLEACARLDRQDASLEEFAVITHTLKETIFKELAKNKKLAEELKECRQILEKQLDRDKDPNDSLRDLVVVACNALYWARAKKKHFVMGKLKAELKDKEAEIERLKGS